MHTKIWKLKRKASARKPEYFRAVYVGGELHYVWGTSNLNRLKKRAVDYALFHKRKPARESVRVREYSFPVSVRRKLKKAA
jgi:hypothetical protein